LSGYAALTRPTYADAYGRLRLAFCGSFFGDHDDDADEVRANEYRDLNFDPASSTPELDYYFGKNKD
jgi:hypothetical protein